MPARPAGSGAGLPRQLALSQALLPLERAIEAAGTLQARLRGAGLGETMTALGARRDALALAGGAPSHEAMLRLMVVEVADERPVPRELQRAMHALGAMRDGLRIARACGRAGLTGWLLGEMQRRLLGGAAAEQMDGHAPLPGYPGAGWAGMQELEGFLADPPALPLPVRLALVAARVVLLEPFEEDSLAVALLLLPAMMAADGRLPLFCGAALVGDRPALDAALQELRATGDWERWICFFLGRMAAAAATATAQLDAAERSGAELEARLTSLRSDSTARRLAQLTPGAPVLTVGSAQDMLGVSFQTANAAVATLVRLGILASYSSSRRNRIFVVRPGLSGAPDAGPPLR